MLQQSAELYLKHYLEINGVKYPHTHDIELLLSMAEENDIQTDLPSEFELIAGTLTLWESKTRYIKDFLLTKRQLDKVLNVFEKIPPLRKC